MQRRASSDEPVTLDGYWVEDGELPASRPSYDPLGRLRLDPQPNEDGTWDALTLIDLEGAARPLSTGAALTYIHTSSLAHGDAVQFVQFADGERRIFDVEPRLGEADANEAAERFQLGRELFRDDLPALLLRVRPRPKGHRE